MIEKIIEDILTAEHQAEEIERSGDTKAREIAMSVQGEIDAYYEDSALKTKLKVKEILTKAGEDGEVKAALKLREQLKDIEELKKAGENNMTKATSVIISGFLKSI